MEPKRIKYRILPTSSAPAATLVLSLISAALIGVVYWPAFVKYFNAPAAADYKLTVITWVYGILLGSYALFGLCTAALGKKTMALSALFALPICLFYVIEKCGALVALLNGGEKGFAALTDVYAANPEYFSGRNLAYIIVAAVCALLALICFWSIIFNKGRKRTFAMFVLVVCAIARALFALYDVRVNYRPLADSGALEGSAYVYQILLHVAAVVFFLTLAVLAIELRRVFPDDEAAKQGSTPAPQPVAVPVQTETPAPQPATEPIVVQEAQTEAAPEPAVAQEAQPAAGEPESVVVQEAQPVTEPAPEPAVAQEAQPATEPAEAAEPELKKSWLSSLLGFDDDEKPAQPAAGEPVAPEDAPDKADKPEQAEAEPAGEKPAEEKPAEV